MKELTNSQREWVINNFPQLAKEENLAGYSPEIQEYIKYLKDGMAESEGFRNLILAAGELSENITKLRSTIDKTLASWDSSVFEVTSLLRSVAEEKKLENFPFFQNVRVERPAKPKQNQSEEGEIQF